MKILTYTELCKLKTFEDRFKYLILNGSIGVQTFGVDRWLNQQFYQRNPEWKRTRNAVIIRDKGCDLGIESREIYDHIIIHHMNPLRVSDITEGSDFLYNPEYLICTTKKTHNAIHYGDERVFLMTQYTERKPYDTVPWKQGGKI